MSMNLLPCPLCGYEAETQPCPHCGQRPLDAAFEARTPGAVGGAVEGLRAVPMGLWLLWTTRGVKRYLVPPVLITFGAFLACFVAAWSWIDDWLSSALAPGPEDVERTMGWFETAFHWLIAKGILVWAAKLSGFLVYLLIASVLTLWIFSVVYEAVAGPFLDEVHGRIEKRWFGRNPRDEIERPTELPVARCALISAIAAVPALLCVVLWWRLSGLVAWVALCCAVLPFLAAGRIVPAYGVWLAWVVRVEGRTLLVSLKASLLAAVLLVPALVLKLIPVVGVLLFGLVAGFATALTLLDIPFSRRQWPLEKRMQFLLRHFAAMVTFGAVSSLVFIVPVLGPIVMVPAASVGGLWLVCRLDKNPLRPKAQRFEPATRRLESAGPPVPPAAEGPT